MPTADRINGRALLACFSANGLCFASKTQVGVSCLLHKFCLHITKSMYPSFKMQTQFNSSLIIPLSVHWFRKCLVSSRWVS